MSAVFENNVNYQRSEYITHSEEVNTSCEKGILATLIHWKAMSRQRSQLAKLDDRMLNDIGLTREQARLEVAKPFWR